MNAADQAIEEIRAVRRAISAEYGHDVAKYLAALREVEKNILIKSNAVRKYLPGAKRNVRNILRR